MPTKKNRRRKELDRKVTSMLRSLVEGKEKKMMQGEINEDNLLSLLLQSNNEHGSHVMSNNNTRRGTISNHMNMDEIIEECKLFYLAGHETTSSLLMWTVVVLAMHQNWQEKAREEVLHLCRDTDPDAEIISHLKIVSFFFFVN